MVVVVRDERIRGILPEGTPEEQLLLASDDVVRQAIAGVSSLITSRQLINVDFADMRTVMSGAGPGLVAIGRASGAGRAEAAADAALSSPLLGITPRNVRGP